MKSNRLLTSKRNKGQAPVNQSHKEHQAPRASKVLAERNQAVVAVGAWVEEGEDFQDHPAVSVWFDANDQRLTAALDALLGYARDVRVVRDDDGQALALLTEEIQEEKRRSNEESLRRFQDEVRHRVVQRAAVYKKRAQPQGVKPQYQVSSTKHASSDKTLMSAGGSAWSGQGRSSQESFEGMRQVRLRLAACRMDLNAGTTSELRGSEWNISPSRHRSYAEQEEEVLEEEEERDDQIITSQHKCPLVQQKVSGHGLWVPDESQPDPGSQPDLRVPQALWPLPDQEELKRQRQSRFLMHRRLHMNIEREQVKENQQHRKHLKRSSRIKAEKEQIRLEEERRMERDRQLAEARQRLEERELLILERLRLEEEERAVELQRRRSEDKGKTESRFIDALRAQIKERFSQARLDLPPLCCCASSFWDSHPDTCANNCVFHNNPKEYAKALQSTMSSLDLR